MGKLEGENFSPRVDRTFQCRPIEKRGKQGCGSVCLPSLPAEECIYSAAAAAAASFSDSKTQPPGASKDECRLEVL